VCSAARDDRAQVLLARLVVHDKESDRDPDVLAWSFSIKPIVTVKRGQKGVVGDDWGDRLEACSCI
jgi:hypothetical protein